MNHLKIAKRKFKLKIKLPPLSWVLVLFIGFLLSFIWFGPIFRIKTIKCVTNLNDLCPDFIIPAFNQYLGQLVYLANFSNTINLVSHNLKEADEITITNIYPGQIQTNVNWASPIAKLSTPLNQNPIYIGANKRIITKQYMETDDLPIITATNSGMLVLSQELDDPGIASAIEIISALKDTSYSIESVVVDSPIKINVYLKKGYRIIFSSPKPISDQLKALHLIMSQSTMDKNITNIDVRTDRPAVF